MRTVTLHHPKLDRTIEVAASAVPIHAASGWVPADASSTTDRDTSSTAAIRSRRTKASTASTSEESTDADA